MQPSSVREKPGAKRARRARRSEPLARRKTSKSAGTDDVAPLEFDHHASDARHGTLRVIVEPHLRDVRRIRSACDVGSREVLAAKGPQEIVEDREHDGDIVAYGAGSREKSAVGKSA